MSAFNAFCKLTKATFTIRGNLAHRQAWQQPPAFNLPPQMQQQHANHFQQQYQQPSYAAPNVNGFYQQPTNGFSQPAFQESGAVPTPGQQQHQAAPFGNDFGQYQQPAPYPTANGFVNGFGQYQQPAPNANGFGFGFGQYQQPAHAAPNANGFGFGQYQQLAPFAPVTANQPFGQPSTGPQQPPRVPATGLQQPPQVPATGPQQPPRVPATGPQPDPPQQGGPPFRNAANLAGKWEGFEPPISQVASVFNHMHNCPVQQLMTTAPEDFTGTFQAYLNTFEWLCDIFKAYMSNGEEWNGQRWPQTVHNEINHYLQTGEFPLPAAEPTPDGSNDDGGASVTGGISVAAISMNITISTGETEASTVVSNLTEFV